MSSDFPITQAVRFLREKKVEFVPRLYDYVERGGTRESAKQLDVDEHAVVKTIVFETNEKKPLIVLMHGDREVSTKNLARFLNVKSVEPATPESTRAASFRGRPEVVRRRSQPSGPPSADTPANRRLRRPPRPCAGSPRTRAHRSSRDELRGHA